MNHKTASLITVVLLTALSASANAFRVTPYVQRPATNAMTIMWLMQEDGQGTVAWQEIGGTGRGSATTTPRLATEFSYLPSQTNYPNHFLPFTIPSIATTLGWHGADGAVGFLHTPGMN
jgi:hypothetical protein